MHRPLVTFMIIGYNHERFVREAVRGALAQTYSPLEIIISDDCSQDRTFELIEEEVADYDGPHKIVLNRNEENLGTAGHLNRLMELAEGELIVVAASDDISLPLRTEEIVKVWSGGGAYSIYSNMTVIDENGINRGVFAKSAPMPIESWQQILRAGRGVFGCTHAWDRAVFDAFGPLPEDVVHEDYAIPFRSALLGKIAYIDECLVKYRRHSTNVWTDRNQLLQMNLPQFLNLQAAKARMSRAHYGSWLRDLRLFLSPHPEQRAEILQAMETVVAKIELCKLEGSIESTERGDRLRSCLQVIRRAKNIGTKPAIKATLLSISPQIYYALQKLYLEFSR